jgi:putative transposase
LGMSPRDAFAMGLTLGGSRKHLQALYDDDFRYVSLASTRKQTAQVKPGRGVKINYVYYHAKAFDVREIHNQQVPVRYDPFDLGTAYAYVQGRWVQARSEHYLRLRGHSERELQLASAELRKQYQNHRRDAGITAKRLADFFADLSGHDTVLRQHWQDAEARDVFAQMQEDQMFPVASTPQEERVPTLALVHASTASDAGEQRNQELQSTNQSYLTEITEDDEDLEDLDEYGRFH